MPSTQITGLGSGINWDETIQQLMEIEKQPLYKKQERLQTLNTKKSAWSNINSQLETFKSTLEGMDSLGEIAKKTATSDSPSEVSVSAGEDASIGTYDIKVSQLANGHKMISESFSSTSDTVFSSNGTFTVQGKSGTPVSIDVTTSTNLSDLKRLINADSNADVTASIMNDGSGYRLILTSKETGADSDITLGGTATISTEFRDIAIGDSVADSGNTGTSTMTTFGETYTGSDDNYTFTVTSSGGTNTVGTDNITVQVTDSDSNVVATLNFDNTYAGAQTTVVNGMEITFSVGDTLQVGDAFTVNTTQPTARDAMIEVENIFITKDSNTVDDVIEGVTLNLNDVTDAGEYVNITIDNDISGVKGLISDFINEYNKSVDIVKDLRQWDEELKTGGPLFGDSASNSLLNGMMTLLSKEHGGLDDTQYFKTLSQVGLELKNDGKIELDSSTFEDALETNYDEVIRLFAFDYEFTGTDKDKFIYRRKTNDTVGGEYDISVTVSGGAITAATIDGVAAKIDGDFLTMEDGSTEGLMIEVDTSADGSFTSQIRVSNGKNVEMINYLNDFTKTSVIDEDKGKIQFEKESIDSTIENLNDQIAALESRLAITQEMMEKKWLAMESAVSEMRNQSARNSAMMTG